jgi:UV DNA damage endonuclease
MEFGLCCLFKEEKIKFKTFTLKGLTIERVKSVYSHNISTLQKAFDYCNSNNIKSYRISSDVLPKFGTLLRNGFIDDEFLSPYLERLKKLNSHNLTLSFHPSQFVNMGSHNEDVIKNSIDDIRDHILLSKYLGVGEINIHIGGAYGNPTETKKRFIQNMRDTFSRDELDLITIENDELNFSISDVIEVCNELEIRAVYDIHHERCFQIGKEINEVENMKLARETWKSYDYCRVHLSSPRDGYSTPSKSRPHHDFIDKNDFPEWISKFDNVHIDIEAKAKEVAILQLKQDLA